MRHRRFNRLSVTAVLAAYLVTSVFSATSLLGQSSFFKLDNSISFRNDRSIVLDERPYWTAHKHLISSEQSSSDHILGTASPSINVIESEGTLDRHEIYLPAASHLFSSNALRAPPLS